MLITSATHYQRTSYESEQRSRQPDEILIVRTLIPNLVRILFGSRGQSGRTEATDLPPHFVSFSVEATLRNVISH
jgi:hypothetical protein